MDRENTAEVTASDSTVTSILVVKILKHNILITESDSEGCFQTFPGVETGVLRH
jgi:hypothetical protein